MCWVTFTSAESFRAYTKHPQNITLGKEYQEKGDLEIDIHIRDVQNDFNHM